MLRNNIHIVRCLGSKDRIDSHIFHTLSEIPTVIDQINVKIFNIMLRKNKVGLQLHAANKIMLYNYTKLKKI